MERNIKLTIELVPKTCWYSNVRDHVKSTEWDMLRKTTYKNAKYICEICGGKGPAHPVECHEIWKYDDQNKIQKLEGLIALRPSCHKVKHIGRTELIGKLDSAETHLCKVNKMTIDEMESYLFQIWEVWKERSKYQWKLDITVLKEYGINIESKR